MRVNAKLYNFNLENRGTIVYKGKYKGFDWEIKTLCSHPTAYIILPNIKCYANNNEDWYAFEWLNVHGEITYINIEETKIGWDYAHCSDFYFNDDFSFNNGHIWTYKEIYAEIKNVINQIIPIEQIIQKRKVSQQ